MLKIRGEISKSDTVAALLVAKAVQSMVSSHMEERNHGKRSSIKIKIINHFDVVSPTHSASIESSTDSLSISWIDSRAH